MSSIKFGYIFLIPLVIPLIPLALILDRIGRKNMSSEKYGYVSTSNEGFRTKSKAKIENILSDFKREYIDCLKYDRLLEINKIEEDFLIIKKSYISKLSSKSLTYSSFLGIENELHNSLNSLYSKIIKRVTNWAASLMENLEKTISKSNDQIEPKDYQKLILKINNFSHSLIKVLDTEGIKKGVDYINSENSNLHITFKNAIQYRKDLQNEIKKVQNQNRGIFEEIEKLNKIKTKSEKITQSKGKIYYQAKELLSKDSKAPSMEDILKFERERYQILNSLYQNIDEISGRGDAYNSLKIQKLFLSIDVVLQQMKTLQKIKFSTPDNKEILLEKIHHLEVEIVAIGIQKYEMKAKYLIKDIESESLEKLKAIETQLKIYLIKIRKIILETSALKNRLFPLKLRVSQSALPEAKGIEWTIEDLILKPILTEREIIDIEKKVKQLREREAQIFFIMEESKNIKEISRVMKDAFVELGYSPITEINLDAKPIYIDTPEKNYKIKLTCNKSGEMLFRFIRVVASEKEREFITELEKQNDIEICKQWRGDYRKLLKKIENMGIYIQEDCQKDPAEDGISIEVNKQLFTWDRKEERSISKNQVRYRNI